MRWRSSGNGSREENLTEIPLTLGKFAYVDEVDADLANPTWHAAFCRRSCYAKGVMRIAPKTVKELRMHRIVLERKLGRRLKKKEMVDHIDGNGLNNSRSNLRVATNAQNSENQRKKANANTSSKFKGVSWHKSTRKWRAYIRHKYKCVHLGLFRSETDAAKAYDRRAKKLFGDFCNLNFPDKLMEQEEQG